MKIALVAGLLSAAGASAGDNRPYSYADGTGYNGGTGFVMWAK